MTQKYVFPLSISEAADAVGLPVTALKYLCKEKFVPVGGGGGHGHKLEFDEKAIAYCCLIAALNKAGIGLKAAGRLIRAISEHKRWPKYLNTLERTVRPQSVGDKPSEADDIFLEIVDGAWIWMGTRTDFQPRGFPMLLGAYDRVILERAKDVVLHEPDRDEYHHAVITRALPVSVLTLDLSLNCHRAALRIR